MGKESEDHMGTVPVEDYMGKGPKKMVKKLFHF